MSQINTSLAGVNLSNSDMRFRDLSGYVLFNTDLTGAKLYGAKISLQCATFDGCKLDPQQIGMLLLMIAMADIDQELIDAIHALVREHVGEECFTALSRYLKLA